MAVSFNLDGQALSFPDWATEATAAQMLEIMKKVAESGKVSKEELAKIEKANKELVKKIAEGNKDAEESRDAQEKHEKELLKIAKDQKKASEASAKEIRETYQRQKQFEGSFFGSLKGAFEAEGESVGVAIASVGTTIFKAGAYASGLVTGMFAYVGNTILGAGDSLNQLAKTGVGFNDTFAGVASSAGMGVSSLGGLTGSFESAAQLIAQNSNVVATQGFGRFRQTMQFAADISEDLGLSFEDSMQQFGDALSRRQSLLNLGNVDQARLNKQTATTVKSQMAYAKALGVSTEELENFVDSLIRDNGLLSASILGMSDTMRSDVIAGIEVFASGLAAMGGKAGQDVAAAFLEAGSTGAIGLSDAATGFVTALPSLAGPMEEFSAAMKSGTLSQAGAQDMVQGLTSQLGNLSAEEKARVKSLAIIGDENAKTLANAIAQFEQSEGKLKDINKALGTTFDMDAVQKGTNQFNKIMSQVSGGFSNAFYSLFANPEVMSVIEDGVKEIFAAFGMGVDDLSGAAMNSADMVKKFVPAIKSFVTFLVDGAKSVAEFFAQFKDGDEYDFGAMFDAVKDKAIGLLLKAFGYFAVGVFGLVMAKHYAKTVLGPKIAGYFKTLFAQHGPTMKLMGQNALAYGKSLFAQAGPAAKNVLAQSTEFAKNLFSSSGAKGVAGKMAGYASAFGQQIFSKGKDIASKVTSMASGFMSKLTKTPAGGGGGGGVGGKVSSMLSGASDSADKATMPMGKSGGFLKSIANAVKKFGDNKVVKGAASLALLGGAVTLAAIGLKKFNEVNFTSIIKGTIALAGLAGVAQLLGKGSTAMIKGAAAVALLGAAVIPMAFGLSLLKDVGLNTVVVMAAGLVTLGLAAAGLGLALPFILAGSVAIAAMGAALIPFAYAISLLSKPLPLFIDSLERMAFIDGGNLAKAAGGLLAVGAAMALMAPLLPFMLIGSLAAPSLTKMADALWGFNLIDAKNLSLMGPAMASIATGMSALSGGALMSGLKDGIGSLFGAESPIDKIRNFAEALKEIDVHPILDVAYALESLVTSSQSLNTAGEQFEAFGEQVSPLIRKMVVLSHSIEDMGPEPFAMFNTLGPLSESSLSFASSIDSINNSLDNIDGEYISDQFTAIGDSISYMAESFDQISMGDMLKLGAMKFLGPSKEEKEAEAQKEAVSSVAFDKLHGTGGPAPGLLELMDRFTQTDGKNAYGVGEDALSQMRGHLPSLGAAGIDVDTEALSGNKGNDALRKEMTNITSQLQKQIDMYSMSYETGKISPASAKTDQTQIKMGGTNANVDSGNVPITGQQAQVTQATTQTTPSATPNMKSDTEMMEADGISEKDLLQELIRLQTENNKLLRREMKAIEDNV